MPIADDISRFSQDVTIVHRLVHEDTQVLTEGGPVDSFPRVLNDLKAQFMAEGFEPDDIATRILALEKRVGCVNFVVDKTITVGVAVRYDLEPGNAMAGENSAVFGICTSSDNGQSIVTTKGLYACEINGEIGNPAYLQNDGSIGATPGIIEKVVGYFVPGGVYIDIVQVGGPVSEYTTISRLFVAFDGEISDQIFTATPDTEFIYVATPPPTEGLELL